MQKKIIIGGIAVVILVGALLFIQGNGNFFVSDKSQGDHQDTLASYEISPGDVVKKIKDNEDIILLDVRTPEEYEEIHLENAVLLPVQELSQQTLASIGLGENAKDKEIVIYCRSGARSESAYNIMNTLGYTNIKSVAGGIIHWEEDGYPFTETGPYNGPRVMTNENQKEAQEGPRIKLDNTFHDFGVIRQYGGIVKKAFTIKNVGTDILKIGDITTSCSCATAKISDKELSAGEETILTVFFDPDFHEEPLDVFKRTVFIPTNDPKAPEVEVVIQVDIQEGK